MPLPNTTRSYGGIAKSFHWLTALLMFTVIPLGLIANDLAHQIQSPGFSGSQEVITRATLLFSLHKTIGVTLFFVALFRILWAFTQPKPGLLNADNKPEALAAETVHWLLYGSLVMVPLSGWIHHAATTGFAPIWWPLGQNPCRWCRNPKVRCRHHRGAAYRVRPGCWSCRSWHCMWRARSNIT